MRAGCRLSVRYLGLVLCPLILLGCRNTEPLENELRAKDLQMRELLDELCQNENRNEALQRELNHLRQTGPQAGTDEAIRLHGLKRIVLGRLTGGFDNDGLQGDEALQVVVETRDADDRPAKISGSLQITALEINQRGQKFPLGTWELTPNQLATTWKQGLLGTGYHVLLPWKKPPTTEHLRIEARFTLAPGITFEADKDIKVRLIPGARANQPTMPPPEVVPFPPNPLKLTPTKQSELTPAGNWQPGTSSPPIQLGRPEPIVPLNLPQLPDE